jgi:WS/DGAT/MGAT family acyltransferase
MALIWRIHHCMADGTTCVRLGSAVLWSEDPSSAIAAPSTWTPRRAPGALSLFAAGLAQPHLSSGRLPRPALALRSLWTSEAVVKRELRPRASLTSLAHEAGAARSVAFARAPLAACKAAGKRIYAAVTLNDVVLALVAGGVRTWMQGAGDTAKEIRVKVPVSLHHDGEDGFAANRDSYFFVDLPVGEPDIARRVLAINRETSERKLAHDAETLYRLGRHPAIAHWAMSPRVFTFNVSNVRGPAQPIYVIDALVREMYSLGEIARRHALRFAVISFGDSLFFGLCADRDAVSGVHLLADGIRRATDELLMI